MEKLLKLCSYAMFGITSSFGAAKVTEVRAIGTDVFPSERPSESLFEHKVEAKLDMKKYAETVGIDPSQLIQPLTFDLLK